MCQLCEINMKSVRVLLAAKIVGCLPKEDDTELEQITDDVIADHAKKVARISESDAAAIAYCPDIKERLKSGIRKVLPTIPIEERFRMALAAGKVTL